MSQTQVAYLIDFALGFIAAGLLGVAAVFPTSGSIDWRTLGIAFLGGVAGFLRKYLQVHYGTDAPPPKV